MSPTSVLLVLGAYVALLFVVAWLSGRHADNAGFFSGNRRTPWYMASFAMIAGAMSGVTFVSVPGSVGHDSFSYMQMVLGFAAGQLVVAFVLIPLFYRFRIVSLYEYLGARFGRVSHRTGAWIFFVSKMLRTSLSVYLVCAVAQQLVCEPFGLPFAGTVAVTLAFVWLYTRRGGVKSLVWTDSLKTLCLLAGLLVPLVCIVRALGLSSGEALHAVVDSPHARIFFFDDPASDRYFWKMFPAGLFSLVAMTGLDQDMMQKNLSCRSARDAQKNIVLTALCQTVVILLFLALGALLYLYLDRTGQPVPERGDRVFPFVAVDGGLPLAAGLFFVVGVISGTWSSAGSSLTALTTSVTVDLFDGPRRLDEGRLARLRRGVHLSVALLMYLTVLGFGASAGDSVINVVYRVAGYTYGPILGMFAFGICCRRRIHDRAMPVVALAAPALCALLRWGAWQWFGYSVGFELLVYNALFTMFGMWILSLRCHEKS